ncbi:MAG: polysaccharide biosynthesis/export family protein [Phycisphaerales bacterium]|nr:polysaccharide biosynthesis/export family protein [Phycisphaerales bacterium]
MARNLSRTKQFAPLARRTLSVLALACATAGFGGCQVLKNIGDYANLRNSLLNPSEVGRFDKESPWGLMGTIRPVKWPILDALDLVDQPADPWAAATDPTPADLVPDRREFTLAPGDVVRVSIFGLLQPDQEFSRDLTLNQSGYVTIPYLRMVDLSGLTAMQAQEKLKQVAIDKRVLPEEGNGNPGPQISVSILQSQARTFSVIGQVGRASVYGIFTADLRLLTAIAQIGDISSAGHPGLDYIYIIRTTEEQPTAAPSTLGTSTLAPPQTAPAANPLDAIESIEREAAPAPVVPPPPAPVITPALPAPTPTPSIFPTATGPQLVRPLPAAVSLPNGYLAQADLEAALSNPGAAATTAPMPKPAAAAPADDLLNQAMGTPTTTRPGQYVWIEDKWVLLPGSPEAAPQPAAAAAAPTADAPEIPVPPIAPVANAEAATPPDVYTAVENLTTTRIIRIPVQPLRTGDPRYNIIIRPGDVINVQHIEQGEFYMMGHVSRPGVYQINGRKITLKQAVAAAGGLDGLAIPRRCDLIRRIGNNQEATVSVNLQAIFDGEQADIFLKPNDIVNIGTDAIAPFLAVTRNAYRFSYGFGFVYDRNYAYRRR